MYYGGTSVTCYNGQNKKEVTCPTGIIDETAKTLIDNYTWNTGAITWNDATIVNQEAGELKTIPFYNAERGSVNGKICTGGSICNDTVERTTTWTGYVGLPYVTDWAYASSESVCETNMWDGDIDTTHGRFNMTCKNNNWMHRSNNTWYLSPCTYSFSDGASHVWNVGNMGYVSFGSAAYTYAVVPSIYLKSNVLIESGAGTSSNPYILKAGS